MLLRLISHQQSAGIAAAAMRLVPAGDYPLPRSQRARRLEQRHDIAEAPTARRLLQGLQRSLRSPATLSPVEHDHRHRPVHRPQELPQPRSTAPLPPGSARGMAPVRALELLPCALVLRNVNTAQRRKGSSAFRVTAKAATIPSRLLAGALTDGGAAQAPLRSRTASPAWSATPSSRSTRAALAATSWPSPP